MLGGSPFNARPIFRDMSTTSSPTLMEFGCKIKQGIAANNGLALRWLGCSEFRLQAARTG